MARCYAMTQLGNGFTQANHHAAALSVKEAEMSILRRLGAPEYDIAIVQSNLAGTYHALGRHEDAIRAQRNIYSGNARVYGEEHRDTLLAASNYALSLLSLQRFEEAKSLVRKTMPVAQRVLGEDPDITLKLRLVYAQTLYQNSAATLDDLHEAVNTVEETERIARRMLGGSHPLVVVIEHSLRNSRAALRAREAPVPGDGSAIREAMAAMTPGDR